MGFFFFPRIFQRLYNKVIGDRIARAKWMGKFTNVKSNNGRVRGRAHVRERDREAANSMIALKKKRRETLRFRKV